MLPRYEAILRLVPLGARIPRTIVQTYKTRDLPPELVDNMRRLRAINPEWDYCFFDDARIRDFIAEQYGSEILSYFDRISPLYGAARADLFRYLAIYRFGGVYLDIKSGVTIPLDDTIRDTDQFLLSHWQNDAGDIRAGWGMHPELGHVPFGEYQQWHIMSVAGHPFLRAVILAALTAIDAYQPWVQGIRQQAVLNVTGPIAYTRAIFPLLSHHSHREVRNEEDIGLCYSFTPDFLHKRFFVSHYTRVWAPFIDRPGWIGIVDRGYSRLLQLQNFVAAKTFPLRRKVRSMVGDR